MPPPIGMTKTNIQPPRRRDQSSSRRDRDRDRDRDSSSTRKPTSGDGKKVPPGVPAPKLKKPTRSTSRDGRKDIRVPPERLHRSVKSSTPPPPRARVADFLGSLGESIKSNATTQRSAASRHSARTATSEKRNYAFSESSAKEDIPSLYTAKRGPAPPPPPAPPRKEEVKEDKNEEQNPKEKEEKPKPVDYTALLESSMNSVKEEIDVSSPPLDQSESPVVRASVRSLSALSESSLEKEDMLPPKTPGTGLSAGMRLGNVPTPVRPVPPARNVNDTYKSQWQGLIDGQSDTSEEPSPADRISKAVERSKAEQATASPPESSISQIISITNDDLDETEPQSPLQLPREPEPKPTPEPEPENEHHYEHQPQSEPTKHLSYGEPSLSPSPSPATRTLQSEVNVHVNTINLLEKERNAMSERLLVSEGLVDTVKREAREREEEYLQSIRAAEVTKGENKKLVDEIQRLRDGVAAGWTEHEALRSKASESARNQREVEVQLIRARSIAERHDQELDQFRKETERAERDQAVAERKCEQLEVQVQALQLELHKQKAYLEESETKCAEAQRQLAAMRKGESEEVKELKEELIAMDEMREQYYKMKQELNTLKFASRESEIIETLRTEVRILREREATRGREDTLLQQLDVAKTENDQLKSSPVMCREVQLLHEELEKERQEKHQMMVSSSKALLEGAKEAATELEELREQNKEAQTEIRTLTMQLQAALADRDVTQQDYWNKLLGKCEDLLLPKEEKAGSVSARRGREPERVAYMSHSLGMPPRSASASSNTNGHLAVAVCNQSLDLPSPPRLAGRSPSPGTFTPCPADPRPASSPPRRVASVSGRIPAAPVLRRC